MSSSYLPQSSLPSFPYLSLLHTHTHTLNINAHAHLPITLLVSAVVSPSLPSLYIDARLICSTPHIQTDRQTDTRTDSSSNHSICSHNNLSLSTKPLYRRSINLLYAPHTYIQKDRQTDLQTDTRKDSHRQTACTQSIGFFQDIKTLFEKSKMDHLFGTKNSLTHT